MPHNLPNHAGFEALPVDDFGGAEVAPVAT